MSGRRQIQFDILAAAHVNCLVIHGQRFPASVGGLKIPLSVELFQVQILHIGVQSGNAPRHMLVVPGHHKRQSRQRYAGCVKPRRAQIGHVPDVWLSQSQMHVV